MQVTTVHYEEVTLLLEIRDKRYDKTTAHRVGKPRAPLSPLKGLKGALGCILFKAFSFPADNNRIVNNRRKNLHL